MNRSGVVIGDLFPLTRAQRIERDAHVLAVEIICGGDRQPSIMGADAEWCTAVFDRAIELLETAL